MKIMIKCNCGEIMQNTVVRIKDYGEMLKNVHKNIKDYQCSKEDLDWYKLLLRDNLNAEKQFQKLVENLHIKYCK